MIDLKENKLFTYKPGRTNVFSAVAVTTLNAFLFEVEYIMQRAQKIIHFKKIIRADQMVYLR